MRPTSLQPHFVKLIPEKLEDGVLYISKEYKTAVHKCCCGCGNEVVTPLGPTDWQIRQEEGTAVSMYPSVGSWSLPCRSHYWIIRNRIQWAEQWSDARIAAARAHERTQKDRYYNTPKESFWSWLWRLITGK